jgi:hypothetical protein
MKYLLSLLLVLSGCYHATQTSVPEKAVLHQSTNGRIDDIHFSCEQEEVNESLVWVTCRFTNVGLSTQNKCLRISYFKYENDQVTISRDVCSGPLVANQSSSNYAAFTQNERKVLRSCGVNLENCAMMARWDRNNAN